jgi:protein-S-isoprenylcysteine O-methyltransferase Ste14
MMGERREACFMADNIVGPTAGPLAAADCCKDHLMSTIVFAIGAAVALTLLALLVATRLHRPLRIWPTPGPGSWQTYVFWPLFRGLNVLCFAMALSDRASGLGLPQGVRLLAFVLLAVSVAVFVYAFRVLGRDNSYGAQTGLVTAGIYQWSRNPQNAMLIVVYACLAFAADAAGTYILCAAMMAVYAVMVLAEEPWLQEAYGDAYRAYCASVPRFFNWQRLVRASART